MVEPIGVNPGRRTSDSMATPVSFNEASSSLTMRFHQQHHPTMLSAPLTPATPSSLSDEEPSVSTSVQTEHPNLPSPGDRRLSVKSLLSGSSNSICATHFTATWNDPFSPRLAYPHASQTDDTIFYGYDLGQIDEDIGKNDDHAAISHDLPAPLTPQEQAQEFLQGSGLGAEDALPFDFRFGDRPQRHSAGRGGYYKEPVAIKIPRDLSDLPSKFVTYHCFV